MELSSYDACLEIESLSCCWKYCSTQTSSGTGFNTLIKFKTINLCSQVTPLTALKFAELSVRAGFPKGVINILPGKGEQTNYNCNVILCIFKGSVIGQALCDHMDVRKIGFTGSTEVGKGIMKRYCRK